MKIIKLIKPVKIKQTNWPFKTTVQDDLQQMMEDAGYSPDQIKVMTKEKRILITPTNLRAKLKASQVLIIVDELPISKPRPVNDRFDDLEEE